MNDSIKRNRKRKISWLILSGSSVLVLGILILARIFNLDGGSSEVDSSLSRSNDNENGRSVPTLADSIRTVKLENEKTSAEDHFAGLIADIRRSDDSAVIREKLDSLRDYLTGLSAEEAIRVMGGFLESGEDLETELGFSLGPDHYLTSAPTLRTFLMDLVAKVDKVTAGQMGRAILEDDHATSDEWALAMRNVAWSSQSRTTRDYLVGKALDMLEKEEWYREPTVGMLEAFDVFVYAEAATAATPRMLELARDKDRPDLGHAAFLTMDRLTLRQPARVLNEIMNDPVGFAGREAMVSNLFARADVRNPNQREVLERYLLHPARSEEELKYFAGIYPSENYIQSYNLLSRDPWRGDVRQRDLAALQVLEREWLNDVRFEGRKEILGMIQSRLRQFVGGTVGN